jgi:hypothetical protein
LCNATRKKNSPVSAQLYDYDQMIKVFSITTCDATMGCV